MSFNLIYNFDLINSEIKINKLKLNCLITMEWNAELL